MKKVPPYQIALSVGALVIWLLLYASGLLCETVVYRIDLAPHTMANQIGTTHPAYSEWANWDTPSGLFSFTGTRIWSFIVAFFGFTPTNLVLLTLAAAFMGGTVSNVVASSLEDHERAAVHPRKLSFLAEHPLAATMRGFVIYLCVIAGLYLAMDDPFKETSPGQYARLAGTLSLVAFVVGYDPSRIETWLRLVPTPAPRGGAFDSEVRHEVTTQVTRQETLSASAPASPPPGSRVTQPPPAAEPVPVGAGSVPDDEPAAADGHPHRPPQPR